MQALILPNWFNDMSYHQIQAAKCLMRCQKLKLGIDESDLEGVPHHYLTEAALDVCSQIYKIQPIGEKMPVGQIMLTGIPFNTNKIYQLLKSRGVEVDGMQRREEVTIFTLEMDEDEDMTSFRRTIQTTADRLYDILHADSMVYEMS